MNIKDQLDVQYYIHKDLFSGMLHKLVYQAGMCMREQRYWRFRGKMRAKLYVQLHGVIQNL